MRSFCLVVLFVISCNALSAQVPADTIPPYKQSPHVPPFTLIVAPDSTVFTKDNLKKKQETIIMIFSPDCSHCIHSTEDMLTHAALLKNVQIVMASPLDYGHISQFYKDMKLADYPNIRPGFDNGFFLGTFFDVHSYPAIFLYDKKGKFKRAFDASATWDMVTAAL